MVKSYIDNCINIRHVKDLLTHSFALSDKSFLFTIENMEEDGKMITNAISSNDKLYLDHYDSVFENLWKKGIDIQERIREIEEGYNFNIETIPNPKESLKCYKQILQTVNNEILIMLASSSSFFRFEKNIGYSNLEKLAYENIKVKILFPMEESQEQINEIIIRYPRIEFRILQSKTESFIGLTIIDKQRVLITEIKDDTKINYTDSIGATINIFGKSTALSYASIFNRLWKQTDLYDKIQIHDKMQQEFINTAAHELKTPIQPILGFSQIVKDKIHDKELKEMLEIVIKNTNRLKRLTEDILDVTRIEGNKLHLKKESIHLWEFLYSIIKEFGHSLQYNNNDNNKNAKLNIYFRNIDLNTVIFVDKNRISQVVLNLLSNSVKFISVGNEKNDDSIGGNISLIVERTKSNSKDNKNNDGILNEIIISVKDNGQGIDPDIFPRLFTKFTSKSFQGTGLGLYISKNIVESHGGKIWAKNNNEDGKGATFSFSLPFANDSLDCKDREK